MCPKCKTDLTTTEVKQFSLFLFDEDEITTIIKTCYTCGYTTQTVNGITCTPEVTNGF